MALIPSVDCRKRQVLIMSQGDYNDTKCVGDPEIN